MRILQALDLFPGQCHVKMYALRGEPYYCVGVQRMEYRGKSFLELNLSKWFQKSKTAFVDSSIFRLKMSIEFKSIGPGPNFMEYQDFIVLFEWNSMYISSCKLKHPWKYIEALNLRIKYPRNSRKYSPHEL